MFKKSFINFAKNKKWKTIPIIKTTTKNSLRMFTTLSNKKNNNNNIKKNSHTMKNHNRKFQLSLQNQKKIKRLKNILFHCVLMEKSKQHLKVIINLNKNIDIDLSKLESDFDPESIEMKKMLKEYSESH